MKKKPPRSQTAQKNLLKHTSRLAASEVKRALLGASEAIDRQTQEGIALRRILIAERAQVIYYAEKYRSMVAHECLDLTALGWLDLKEELQEKFIKLAVKELNCEAAIVSHDAEAAAVGEQSAELGKKIIQ